MTDPRENCCPLLSVASLDRKLLSWGGRGGGTDAASHWLRSFVFPTLISTGPHSGIRSFPSPDSQSTYSLVSTMMS